MFTPMPAAVSDNLTPFLAQVQYFLGMEQCLAGITADEKPKIVQPHETKGTSRDRFER
jgi:hypothetical protein